MPVESRNLRKELKSGGGLEKCRRNLQNRFRLTIFAVGCYHRENIIIAGSTACNMIRRFIKYMHVSDLMLMRPSLSAFGQAACFTPPFVVIYLFTECYVPLVSGRHQRHPSLCAYLSSQVI